ncbi:MAG TPA: hypothetical protein VMB84_00970 [Stellaceae bacterium]|nr:hypothetical protein [Stellaceae bacterium]
MTADDLLVLASIGVLLTLASGLSFSSDAAAIIKGECDLFYGPRPEAVHECLVQMYRRHFLPTQDESTMNPGYPSEPPAAGGPVQ